MTNCFAPQFVLLGGGRARGFYRASLYVDGFVLIMEPMVSTNLEFFLISMFCMTVTGTMFSFSRGVCGGEVLVPLFHHSVVACYYGMVKRLIFCELDQ